MIELNLTTREATSLLVLLEKQNKRNDLECSCREKLYSQLEKATNEDGLWYVVLKSLPDAKSKVSEAKFALRKLSKENGSPSGFSIKTVSNFFNANKNYKYGLSPALYYDEALRFYHILKDLDFVCELKRNSEFELNDNYQIWQEETAPF